MTQATMRRMLALLTLAAAACSGKKQDAPEVLTGAFVDSPVENVGYKTETRSGVTGAHGEFNYLAGEHVTFSIGLIALPSAAAKAVVTPLTLVGTNDVTDRRVVNIGRLLISLDANGNPDDRIEIPAAAAAAATAAVEFDVDAATFSTSTAVTNLMSRLGKTLVSSDAAIAHLQRSVGIVGTWTGPDSAVTATAADADDEVLVLFRDGTFIFAETGGELPNGLEAGTYAYDPAAQTITLDVTYQHSTNGGLGAGTSVGDVVLDGDTLTLRRHGTDSAAPGLKLVRHPIGTDIVGTWTGRDSDPSFTGSPDDEAEVFILLGDGRFVFAERSGLPDNGVEAGTYVYDPVNQTLTGTRTFTDGTTGGVGPGTNTASAILSTDGSQLTVQGPSVPLVLHRQ